MAIILGIDPGLVHTGWGVISAEGNSIKYISSGRISPNASLSMAERLKKIYLELKKILELYRPTEVSLEETFVNKNPQTSLKLGQARGAIILTIANFEINIFEYAARLVKKTVVGYGRAEKNQVLEMLKLLLPGAKIDSYDAADAIALAICHASHSKRVV